MTKSPTTWFGIDNPLTSDTDSHGFFDRNTRTNVFTKNPVDRIDHVLHASSSSSFPMYFGSESNVVDPILVKWLGMLPSPAATNSTELALLGHVFGEFFDFRALGLSQPFLPEVLKLYDCDQDATHEITAFLFEHPHLITFLYEAYFAFKHYFGQEIDIKLEIEHDPEVPDWTTLFAMVQAPPALHESAHNLLDQFSTEWLLSFIPKFGRIFGVAIDYL